MGVPALSAQARDDFSQHLLGVIRSDPELLGLATDLAGMYREMDRVQDHFRKLQEERCAAQAAKKAAARERAKERERERGYKLRSPHPRAT